MGAENFDFKDYFTIAGCTFTLFLIFLFVVLFIYDIKTKYVRNEGKLKKRVDVDELQHEESLEIKWFDKKLLLMMFMAPVIFYGLYFVLYYACRVFNQPLIGMIYWILCGIYPVIVLTYILIAEWHHEETKYGEVSFYQAITGHSITKRLREKRDRNLPAAGKEGDQ